MKYCILKKSIPIGEYISTLYGSGRTLLSVELNTPNLVSTIRNVLDAQFELHRTIPQVIEQSSIMIGTFAHLHRILVNGELNMTPQTFLKLFEPVREELIIRHDVVAYHDDWLECLMDKRYMLYMKYGCKPSVLEIHIDYINAIRKSDDFKDIIKMTTVGYPTVETTTEILAQLLDITYVHVLVPQ